MKCLREMLFLLLCCLLAAAVHAGGREQMNYQGVLTDDDGLPINGQEDLKFSIYDADVAGNELWTETLTTELTQGLFNVILGQSVDLPPIFQSGDDRWMAVAIMVGGNPQWFGDRVKITGVPYAMTSSDGGITGGGDVGYIPKFTGPTEIGNSIIVEDGDKIGIGIVPTSARLKVQNDRNYDVAIEGITTGNYNSAIQGISTGDYPWIGAINGVHEGAGWGVRGTSVNLSGVFGATNSTNPEHAGVNGRCYGAGIGVRGDAGDGYIGVKGIYGSTWGALGYKDDLDREWGVYTDGDLHADGIIQSSTGGFELPDGTVIDEAGDLTSPPVTQYLSIPGNAFLPEHSGTYLWRNDVDLYRSSDVADVWRAPVYLPHGALLTGSAFGISICGTGGTISWPCSGTLIEYDMLTDTETAVRHVDISGTPQCTLVGAGGYLPNWTIDNETNAYYVEVVGIGHLVGVPLPDEDYWLRWARIEYQK